MTNAPHPLIAAALAKPHTHVVITRFDDGSSRRHTTRSAATAENFAVMDRRRMGRPLISRNADLTAGPIVRIVAVDIEPIA